MKELAKSLPEKGYTSLKEMDSSQVFDLGPPLIRIIEGLL